MERIGASNPIDKTAAMVVSKGYQYEPDINASKVNPYDSELPLPTRVVSKAMTQSPYFTDLKGHKLGRLTVLGLSQDHKGLWIVRCQCGIYSARNKKSLLNSKNINDRCNRCNHLALLKRKDQFGVTRKPLKIADF